MKKSGIALVGIALTTLGIYAGEQHLRMMTSGSMGSMMNIAGMRS